MTKSQSPSPDPSLHASEPSHQSVETSGETPSGLVQIPESDPTSKWIGRGLVVLAAVLWSGSGFFAKAPTFLDWPEEIRGSLYAFWRSIFAAGVLIFFVRKIKFSWKLVPTALIFAFMNWTFLNAMVLCESTLAIWLQYSAPAWVFLGSWLFFKESPVPRDWWLLLFAVGGVGLILSYELVGASAYGVLLGLLSGLSFASIVLSIRWCKEFDSAWIIFLNHFVTAVFFLPFLLQNGTCPSVNQSWYLLAFGGIQMGIPYVLFAMALKRISSHEASGLTLLEPILLPLWVYLAWGHLQDYESPALSTLMGGGLILTGLVVRYWPSSQPKSRPKTK